MTSGLLHMLRDCSTWLGVAELLGLMLAANVILALVLYIVLDFDRPRRGRVRVGPTLRIELGASMGVTLEAPSSP